MAQYTYIVRCMQVFGKGKRKKTGPHLMYRTPALNNYLTLLKIKIMTSSKVSLGQWKAIKEKGEESAPLFMKDDRHHLSLLGKGTWGKTAAPCILTSKGTIGAYQLLSAMEKDGILSSFLTEGEFAFETGHQLFVTIASKVVTQVEVLNNSVKRTKSATEYNPTLDGALYAWDPLRNLYVEN